MYNSLSARLILFFRNIFFHWNSPGVTDLFVIHAGHIYHDYYLLVCLIICAVNTYTVKKRNRFEYFDVSDDDFFAFAFQLSTLCVMHSFSYFIQLYDFFPCMDLVLWVYGIISTFLGLVSGKGKCCFDPHWETFRNIWRFFTYSLQNCINLSRLHPTEKSRIFHSTHSACKIGNLFA